VSKYCSDISHGDVSDGSTIFNLEWASAAGRTSCFEILLGSHSAPADESCRYVVQRTTGGAVGSSGTPRPLNISSVAADHNIRYYTITVEPTYTAGAVLLDFAATQRETVRWMAAPGSELLVPAVSLDGIGMKPIGATAAFALSATIFSEE
jgi:hypothetical protein